MRTGFKDCMLCRRASAQPLHSWSCGKSAIDLLGATTEARASPFRVKTGCSLCSDRRLTRLLPIRMKKVLLVDDDAVVRSIYQNKLSMERLNVQVALDGQAALDLVKSFQPDLIILDLMIPKVPGIDVLKRIRRDQATKNIPVIIFTNAYMASKIQEAWNHGATKCLHKASCPPRELLDAVKECLSYAARNEPRSDEGESRPTTVKPGRATASPALRSKASRLEEEEEIEFTSSLRQCFRDGLRDVVDHMSEDLQALSAAEPGPDRTEILTRMIRLVHTLSSNAETCKLAQVELLADSCEALLKKIGEPPKDSKRVGRTISAVCDCLLHMHRNGFPAPSVFTRANILVVDDEVISRKALVRALRRVKLESFAVEDPRVALTFLKENSFDLLFLDVALPGMEGPELCAEIRKLDLHKRTPVIFVSCFDDSGTQGKTERSGGNDFITKPFSSVEIGVRALACVIKQSIPEIDEAARSSESEA